MQLQGENFVDLIEPTDAQIKKRLLALRSFGKHSYASLTNVEGDYVQIAGGGVTCMVECFDFKSGCRYRAFHDKPSPIYPDGTILAFGAGKLRLMADEWFMVDTVVEIFLCLKHARNYPSNVSWRVAPGFEKSPDTPPEKRAP